MYELYKYCNKAIFEFEFEFEDIITEDEPSNFIEGGRKICKKFWSYIKSVKKDSSGVAPLKENGAVVSNARGKADILNRQYESVFTSEDLINLPHLDPNQYPDIPQLPLPSQES